MTKIEYLYGVKAAHWHDISYCGALQLKNELANNVISVIYTKPLKDRTNADTIRINACLRAIKHNDGLLKE